MSDREKTRLRHMLEAAQKAVEFSEGRSQNDLQEDEQLALALIRLLEIIGEAAKAISPEIRKQYSDIPWRQMAGTRDRLIHAYFAVDLDIVWIIVTRDLPSLIAKLQIILNEPKN